MSGGLINTLQLWCERIVIYVRSLFLSRILFEKSGIVVYIEKKVLGEGAFSTVYQAANIAAQQHYALKKMILQSKELDDLATIELEAFRRFQHKNILRLIDYKYSVENGVKVVYLVFPLLRRGTLRNQLNSVLDGKIPKPVIRDVLDQFLQVLGAFSVLHSFEPSYVHRDIKAENILIADDGKPLLTDFGSVTTANVTISNRNDALNVVDDAAQYCTLPYRPPELFDPPTGLTLDARTDVWGIGCLFFAWWFGYSPFECAFNKNGVYVTECSHLRVLGKIPRPASTCVADLLILNLVEWILNKDISHRPKTADLIIRVEELLSTARQDESAV